MSSLVVGLTQQTAVEYLLAGSTFHRTVAPLSAVGANTCFLDSLKPVFDGVVGNLLVSFTTERDDVRALHIFHSTTLH